MRVASLEAVWGEPNETDRPTEGEQGDGGGGGEGGEAQTLTRTRFIASFYMS